MVLHKPRKIKHFKIDYFMQAASMLYVVWLRLKLVRIVNALSKHHKMLLYKNLSLLMLSQID